MTFSTPRKLSSIAAGVFIEELILESKLFCHLNLMYETIASHDMKSFVDKFYFACEVKELSDNIMVIEDIMDKLLKNCSLKTKESLLQILRTTDHYCAIGTIILQFLYDKDINFRQRNWELLPVLVSIQRSFKNVEKLLFDSMGEQSCLSFLCQFLQFLPNLKCFKGVVRKEGKFFTSLRSHCPKITELSLCANEGFISSNQLATFFFCGKSLDSVKKAFVRLDNVSLSFPGLEKFTILGVGFEQYDFFKMFLHFYPKVNLVVRLHHSYMYYSCVSWFDSVLSHNVILNPNLPLTQCELSVQDLFLPFCERSLVKWRNLESLVISLDVQGRRRTPSTWNIIGKRLEALIMKQGKIKELSIRIFGPVNEEEVSEILFPTLKRHGTRLNQLEVYGMTHFLSHRSIVQMLNMCSNLKRLFLSGKRIMKYFKDVKMKPLPLLESLTVIWSEIQNNTTFCQWISKLTSDLLKNCPSIKYLHCTANLFLMDHMTRIKFGSELEELIIYFHTEKSCDGIMQLRNVLKRLPKLRELVVKENDDYEHDCECNLPDHEEDCGCICTCNELADRIYDAVKSYVDNTQVYMRYYTLEDSQKDM